jgi:glucokinase
MIEKLINLADDLLEQKPDAIGISCGGPLDSQNGVILGPPNLPGWDRVEIVKILENHYGVPVKLQNDANACAVAEWKFGAGKGAENVIFLTFGTGFGAGLILDGKLYSGTNGNAGEVGHIRLAKDGPVGYGKAGSFEGFCSGGGLAQLGRTLAERRLAEGTPTAFCKSREELDNITAKLLAEYASAGDPDAKAVFDLCARRLGEGLSLIVDIINPDRIVIGSIYERCEELLAPGMNEVLRREALSPALEVCRVVPASLGDRIGDVAALSVAIDSFGG